MGKQFQLDFGVDSPRVPIMRSISGSRSQLDGGTCRQTLLHKHWEPLLKQFGLQLYNRWETHWLPATIYHLTLVTSPAKEWETSMSRMHILVCWVDCTSIIWTWTLAPSAGSEAVIYQIDQMYTIGGHGQSHTCHIPQIEFGSNFRDDQFPKLHPDVFLK